MAQSTSVGVCSFAFVASVGCPDACCIWPGCAKPPPLCPTLSRTHVCYSTTFYHFFCALKLITVEITIYSPHGSVSWLARDILSHTCMFLTTSVSTWKDKGTPSTHCFITPRWIVHVRHRSFCPIQFAPNFYIRDTASGSWARPDQLQANDRKRVEHQSSFLSLFVTYSKSIDH